MLSRTIPFSPRPLLLKTKSPEIIQLFEESIYPIHAQDKKKRPIVFTVETPRAYSVQHRLYNYSHHQRTGAIESRLHYGHLASATVNAGAMQVSAAVYDLSQEHRSMVANLIFINPLVQLLGVQGYHFIHGALVSKDCDGVLICGANGSGKTSISMMLVKHGFQLLSDDKCLYRTPVTFFPIPQPIHATRELIRRIPVLKTRKIAGFMDPERDRQCIDGHSLFLGSRPRALRSKAIVFPEFSGKKKPALRPLSPADAFERLLADRNNTFHAAWSKKSAAGNIFAIHELTRSAPAYALTYNDRNLKNIGDRMLDLVGS